jgi:DNA-binding PadR family transcriptional regulator
MTDQLGRLEQLVLFAVLDLGEDAYGATIRRAIREKTGRSLTTGAIYTTLQRLERRGLVISHIGDPTAERGGRRKKYYDMAPEGLRVLDRSWTEMREMSAGLAGRLAKRLATIEEPK